MSHAEDIVIKRFAPHAVSTATSRVRISCWRMCFMVSLLCDRRAVCAIDLTYVRQELPGGIAPSYKARSSFALLLGASATGLSASGMPFCCKGWHGLKPLVAYVFAQAICVRMRGGITAICLLRCGRGHGMGWLHLFCSRAVGSRWCLLGRLFCRAASTLASSFHFVSVFCLLGLVVTHRACQCYRWLPPVLFPQSTAFCRHQTGSPLLIMPPLAA